MKRVSLLALLLPFGSVVLAAQSDDKKPTQEVPNPLVLTGTDIPYVPPKRDEH